MVDIVLWLLHIAKPDSFWVRIINVLPQGSPLCPILLLSLSTSGLKFNPREAEVSKWREKEESRWGNGAKTTTLFPTTDFTACVRPKPREESGFQKGFGMHWIGLEFFICESSQKSCVIYLGFHPGLGFEKTIWQHELKWELIRKTKFPLMHLLSPAHSVNWL